MKQIKNILHKVYINNNQQYIQIRNRQRYTTQQMISRILMLTASALCIGGYYFIRKQQFYKDIFQSLNTCQKYHMDYVQDISHLPLNTPIVIYGPVSSLNKQKIISSSFIKVTNQPDRLWKMKIKNSFVFNTAINQPVEINNSQNQVFVFNLPRTLRELKQKQYQQRAIIDGVKTCAYGKIKSDAISKKIIMEPQLIIGNQHQTLLGYLDKQIMRLSRNMKVLTGLGTALFVGHALYYNLYANKTKSNIQQQIEQFKKD